MSPLRTLAADLISQRPLTAPSRIRATAEERAAFGSLGRLSTHQLRARNRRMTPAEKLARAVLLTHESPELSYKEFAERMTALLGADSTIALCQMARATLAWLEVTDDPNAAR